MAKAVALTVGVLFLPILPQAGVQEVVHVQLDLSEAPSISNRQGAVVNQVKAEAEIAKHLNDAFPVWSFFARAGAAAGPKHALVIKLQPGHSLEDSPMTAEVSLVSPAAPGASLVEVQVYRPKEFRPDWEGLGVPALMTKIGVQVAKGINRKKDVVLKDVLIHLPVASGLRAVLLDKAELPLPWKTSCKISGSAFDVHCAGQNGAATVATLGLGTSSQADFMMVQMTKFRHPPGADSDRPYADLTQTLGAPITYGEVRLKSLIRLDACPRDENLRPVPPGR